MSSRARADVSNGVLRTSEEEARAPEQVNIWLLLSNFMDFSLPFLLSSLLLSDKRSQPLDFKIELKYVRQHSYNKCLLSVYHV